MFFDPQCKTETKPDIYALSTLIAWLETMPARKHYDYWRCDCIINQYGGANGLGSLLGSDTNGLMKLFGDNSNLDNYHLVCGDKPWTFGAALKRARALERAS